jgi:peptidoglycan/LPS O-acetylase OafA/YrhL
MNSKMKGLNPHANLAGYRADIDGLRAIAVVSVVLFHAFPRALPGGFVGVDIFFVISGFLITRIILGEVGKGSFSLYDFYARRFRRILPALLVVVAGCIAIGYATLLSFEFDELALQAIAGLGFASNFYYWRNSGYFDPVAELQPLLHLWSLSLEEQFYIFWPLLLLFIRRWGKYRLPCILLLAGVSFAAQLFFVKNWATATFFLLPTRFWELAAGGVVAFIAVEANDPNDTFHRMSLYRALGKHAKLAKEGLLSLGVLLLVAALVFVRPEGFPGFQALLPVMGTALVIANGSESRVARILLERNFLISIGLISYPLYLWHWPLLSFARIYEQGMPSAGVRACIVLLSFVAAVLTWKFVEKPFASVRFGRTAGLIPSSRFVHVSLAGLAGFIAVLVPIPVGAGLPNRFPHHESLREQLKWVESSNGCRSDGSMMPADVDCQSENPAGANILLWGDSHAAHLFPGLRDAVDDEWNWSFMGHSAPLIGVDHWVAGEPEGRRSGLNKLILEEVTTMDHVGTVVLASRGPFYYAEKPLSEHDRQNIWRYRRADELTHLEPLDGFKRGYGNTIDSLTRLGKRVVVFLDVPELNFLPESCLGIRPFQILAKPRSPCMMPVSQLRERNETYREVFKALRDEYSEALFFDPTPHFCDVESCTVMIDDKLLYRDDDHLSYVGSAYIAEKFTRWLTENSAELNARTSN